AGDGLPPETTLVALDTVQLKGFGRSERVHQLCHPALPSNFPPLTRLRAGGLGVWPTALVGRLREREEVAALLANDRLVTITGAVTWRIPPLALPPEGERDPERLGAYDSVRLFGERARAARPGFRLDAASAPVVARVCRRLDGLPLALELAAARVRGLSVERLADGLDDRFRLLPGGARTPLARQQTLLASV